MARYIFNLPLSEMIESGDHAVAAAKQPETPEAVTEAARRFELAHQDLREEVAVRRESRRERRRARSNVNQSRASLEAVLRVLNAALFDPSTGRRDRALVAEVFDQHCTLTPLLEVSDDGVLAFEAEGVAGRAREAGVDAALCDPVTAAAADLKEKAASLETADGIDRAAQDQQDAAMASWEVAWKSFVWTVRGAVGLEGESVYVLAHTRASRRKSTPGRRLPPNPPRPCRPRRLPTRRTPKAGMRREMRRLRPSPARPELLLPRICAYRADPRK